MTGKLDDAAIGVTTRQMLRQLAAINAWLDSDMTDEYRAQPLAHRIMRVIKVCSESGEVLDALSAATGENPRKGVCGTDADLHRELADVCSGALLALVHETGDPYAAWGVFLEGIARAFSRIGSQPVPKLRAVTQAQLSEALDAVYLGGYELGSDALTAELFRVLGGAA